MYNEEYIKCIKEEKLERIITNLQYDYIKRKDESLENNRLFFALQHYLLKCLIERKHTNECIKILTFIYDDFEKHPYYYVNSPLIKNKTLETLFSKKFSDLIKEKRDNYFNSTIAKKIYEKKKYNEITEDEKKQYFSYLIHNLDYENKEFQNIIYEEINNIINTKDIKQLSKIEIQFYSQYVSNYAIKDEKIKIINLVAKDRPSLLGCQGYGLIQINSNQIKSIEKLTQTICHESQHAIEEYESTRTNSKTAFIMAQHNLFLKYLDTDSYNSYQKNYNYSSIELDAENKGYYKAIIFFHMFNRHDLAKNLRKEKKILYNKRNYYTNMVNENNSHYQTDIFITNNLDNIIKNNPKELDNYPVLKQIYNSDGTKKSFSEIVLKKVYENENNKGVFDNYIRSGIYYNKLNEVPIDTAKKENINNFFKKLSYIFRENSLTIIDYLYDEKKKNIYSEKKQDEMKKTVEKTTIYQIKIAKNILNYVNENFSIMINNLNEDLNNRSYVYNFIHDFRNFNEKIIKNKFLNNNDKVKKEIKEMLDIYKKVYQKFNLYYTKRILNERLSKEEKSRKLILSNKEILTLEEYIIKYIVPNLNENQKITINNQELFITTAIRELSNKTQEEIIKHTKM